MRQAIYVPCCSLCSLRYHGSLVVILVLVQQAALKAVFLAESLLADPSLCMLQGELESGWDQTHVSIR